MDAWIPVQIKPLKSTVLGSARAVLLNADLPTSVRLLASLSVIRFVQP